MRESLQYYYLKKKKKRGLKKARLKQWGLGLGMRLGLVGLGSDCGVASTFTYTFWPNP